MKKRMFEEVAKIQRVGQAVLLIASIIEKHGAAELWREQLRELGLALSTLGESDLERAKDSIEAAMRKDDSWRYFNLDPP